MTRGAGVPTTLSVMEHALFPEAPPPTLGRFEIARQLGRGGMGVVYLAHDPELKRDVAIKVHGRGADTNAHMRMRREAEALARLNHRNAVTVYEVGATEHGDVFVVMEYLPGLTLDAWVTTRAPSSREIVAMMIRCARGLSAAHDAGLVHRDFKPSNVVLGDDGEPKIIDFGLARAGAALDAGTTDAALVDAALTQDGALAGTPRYMAPELWHGDPPSARSDQFALCVALYELVASRPPYEPRRFEIAPRRPAGIDRRVWAALLRGLDPDPRARWGSMRELADALESAIAPRSPRMVAGLGLATAVGLGALAWRLADPRADAPSSPATLTADAADDPVAPAPCPLGVDLLATEVAWTSDEPSALTREPTGLRLTTDATPAGRFVGARTSGAPMSFHDRALEFEVVAAPSRGEPHELIVGLQDEAGVFVAGILVMGGRWVFPLAPGLRELGIDVGPRDRFYRLQVQSTPGKPETITFETSQDRRQWRPFARTLGRVPAARPMITIGSHEPHATADAAVVRAMRCSVLQPVAEIPYERDLSQPRSTDAPAGR
jgi:predicted Ser/Thr protein kinase